MILGLRTVCYCTPDIETGKAWYRQAFEKDPYFDQPFYVGFEIGGFELGLIPDGDNGVGGTIAYWGTKNVAAEVESLTGLGATVVEGAKDVGGGIIVATLQDPFGNLLGVIENPYFDVAKVA